MAGVGLGDGCRREGRGVVVGLGEGVESVWTEWRAGCGGERRSRGGM